MRKLQLYMFSGMRRLLLDRHNFYVEQVSARVLSQFPDIEAEANAFGDKEFDRLMRAPAREDIDAGALAEFAEEQAQQHYMLLRDLKEQMFLGALAGMYHQWEKDMRDFIERELAHDIKNPEKYAWSKGSISEILKAFGWDTDTEPFFKKIDACRIIVNVYKHGKGPSLTTLAQLHPEYLRDPLASLGRKPAFLADMLDYEWLTVSPQQFDELANAFRRFWNEFPERLFLEAP